MLEAWKSASNAIPLKIVGEGPLAELVVAAGRACREIEYLGSTVFAGSFGLDAER